MKHYESDTNSKQAKGWNLQGVIQGHDSTAMERQGGDIN